MSSILVAGSGRMGRDLGLWLLRQGHRVCWISRQTDRLDALRTQVERVLRRWQREDRAVDATAAVAFGTPASLATRAAPDILLEAVEEEVTAKREVLRWAATWGEPQQPLLLSTTSSFLPQQLHPRCLVTHFFFPVELTGLVEIVYPTDTSVKDRERLHNLLDNRGIYAIEQTGRQAFAVNRMLLPAHAECVRAVRLGLAPALADQAAMAGLLGLAPLALAERVGHATLRAALANYLAATDHADDYGELVQALAAARDDAPPARVSAAPPSLAEASDSQQAVQLNTCLRFVQDGLISARDLDWLLPNYYGRSGTLAAHLAQQDRPALAARLQALYAQTGRHYFRPTRGPSPE